MAKGKFTGGKPIQPGEVRNPTGKPRLGLVDEAKHTTKKTLIKAMCDCLGMTVEELGEVTLNPQTTAAVALVGRIIVMGIKKGSPSHATPIFNYILGRPQEYKPDGDGDDEKLQNLLKMVPQSVLAKALKEHHASKSTADASL